MTTGVPIHLYVAGSTLLDAVVAAVVFLGGRRDVSERVFVDLPGLARAGLATAASFLAKLPFFSILGVGLFGFIHLAYADLVVLLPLAGALLHLSASPFAPHRVRLHLTPSARLAATALTALAAVGIYASWIEPFRLRMETAHLDVSDGRTGHSPVRIGVLSDIQTDRVTDHERRAIEALMATKPDVILIPGDVFQGTEAEFHATRSDLRDMLSRLSAPGGVYLVLGDMDDAGEHLREILVEAGIRLLVDEAVAVEVGDRRLTIGGVSLDFQSRASRSLVERLEGEGGKEDVRILLAHRPDVVMGLRPGSRIDLVVAGHTHGGQVVIPGFGPPMTLSRVPRNVAAGGLHQIDSNAIYVSRGLGVERNQAPRIRFFCPPEVAVVEIADGRSGSPGKVSKEAIHDRGVRADRPGMRPTPGANPDHSRIKR